MWNEKKKKMWETENRKWKKEKQQHKKAHQTNNQRNVCALALRLATASCSTPLVLCSSNAQLIIMLKIYFPFSVRRCSAAFALLHSSSTFFSLFYKFLGSLPSFFNQFAYKLVITCSLYYLFRLPLSAALRYPLLPSPVAVRRCCHHSRHRRPYHFVKYVCECGCRCASRFWISGWKCKSFSFCDGVVSTATITRPTQRRWHWWR